MITKSVIYSIYQKYNKRPASPDELNLGALFGEVFDTHNISINENSLVIGSVDPDSPFHEIPLSHIHEIVEFADHIAIVLHSSIIFLSKTKPDTHIHIKQPSLSLGQRLRNTLHCGALA